jgi:hypothetical protein
LKYASFGKLQSKPFKELEDNSLTLLELDSGSLELDRTSVELLLDDCKFSSEDEDSDFTELDEASSVLLLDFPVFSLLLDCFTSLWVSLDEDFAFSLLDEVTSEESSFGLAEGDHESSSSHPTTANATKPIATRNFFINASKRCLSKKNVIYFHQKKSKTSPKHQHKSRPHITDGKNFRGHCDFQDLTEFNRTSL